MERLRRVADRLVAANLGVAEVVLRGAHELRCEAPRVAMPPLADLLRAELGAELELLAGADTRRVAGAFTLVYRFASRPPGPIDVVAVEVRVPPDHPVFPSLATRSFAASRYEREVQDLLGLTPVGHPDPRRLPLHQFWPEGYHPLRADAPPPGDFADDGRPYPFRRVEGEGIFEITVGPVHAGIIEPGHFRFSVEGETIVNLETRLYFVHKGIEKLFETLPLDRTVALAERISGDTSVGHALAYCEALEALAGLVVPPRAALLRVLFLELERLYNHVGDVGAILNDTGYAFAHAHCGRLREDLLRLDARLTGHRLLRGAVVPGGIGVDIPDAAVRDAAAAVGRIIGDFEEVTKIALGNTLVLERLQGTGQLTRRTAEEMQVVGLVARASGLDADARRDSPFAAYGELAPRIAVHPDGDVWARTMVRIEEAREAARLVGEVAARLLPGPLAVPLGRLPGRSQAFGLVEAWRGPILHWVLTGPAGELLRVKVKDPSFVNWPALEYAVLKNIVPDFPLCNKSFNLSYSGNDL
ncbi:MAG: NADH-quinone oxidoreductase subunit C [Candidatus Rokubacteria bacterium]|nr:NADH-quinone oxidoreductase subunit C [Candidatus Rokubacteria bacterium]